MPKFLEDRLKAQAASKGLTGKQADRYTYGTLNNLMAMHGNVETAKGRAMDAKHVRDTKRPSGKQTKTSQSGRPRNLGKYLHPKGGY